ncbi:NAD(P)-dependent oxidoreductase [Marinomonas mediterranea]|uniref:3-hydroxyisobutyrate dehydrogenase n=1 Tax=Marinomonas mediterranea (strain ATCC 700492 / JCM 21426 / NBRC 103028 / MMB-1) TaxID=717774 RepID=F2K3W4_MARM1|nr:NAD(P)-dependent oxidoreductase [Marinomonas mediterranea]ADZ90213.1 3-hydroxyisobutyrate dehydrogenase [Marinomonas mediterranea MMB-1]WCN16410.1 NAD-binding protein [Marinomonas mediterranea MMB-1]
MQHVIGVIGLGNMGRNMAATLVKKEFTVYGFDLSADVRQLASEQGILPENDVLELAKKCSTIILSLPKAEHVEAVCLGENGLKAVLNQGTTIIDTTTSVAETSRKVAQELESLGVEFVDAPVSGGPAGAASGTMSMVVGGKKATYEHVLPVLEAMTRVRIHVGEVGAGNIAKIANNLLAAAHLITTAEALTMAEKAGLDPEQALQAISAGSGGSAASQVMFPNWVMNKAYNSGFTMALMRKDVGLAKDLVESLGLDLPMAQKTAELWRASVDQVEDSDDFCAIAKCTNPALFGEEK